MSVPLGKCQGSCPGSWGGAQLMICPRLLNQNRPKKITSHIPLRAGTPPPPPGAGTPFRDGTTPAPPLWEGLRGSGSRLKRGSRFVAFSDCGCLDIGIPRAGTPLEPGPRASPEPFWVHFRPKISPFPTGGLHPQPVPCHFLITCFLPKTPHSSGMPDGSLGRHFLSFKQ